MRLFLASALLMSLAACGDDPVRTVPDAGLPDVDGPDADVSDLGAPDAAADLGAPDALPDADACAPMCEGRTCGDDGCGGSCGECAGECVEGVCELTPASCPPTGPYGTSVGAIAPDVELFDCTGASVRLHELCDHEVTWLFEFADWCPPCRSFARDDAQRIYDANAGGDFEGYFVISADSSFDAPDAALCNEITERYGLTMPVLFDPTGALQAGLEIDSNSQDLVFSRGMRIEWIGKYDGAMVQTQIDAARE